VGVVVDEGESEVEEGELENNILCNMLLRSTPKNDKITSKPKNRMTTHLLSGMMLFDMDVYNDIYIVSYKNPGLSLSGFVEFRPYPWTTTGWRMDMRFVILILFVTTV